MERFDETAVEHKDLADAHVCPVIGELASHTSTLSPHPTAAQ